MIKAIIIIRASTRVLATVLTSPSSEMAMAVNLVDIPRCVACVLFWVHLFVTFDSGIFKEVVIYLTLSVLIFSRNRSPTRFFILAICQTSTAFLFLINMIKVERSCAVWSLQGWMKSRIQVRQLTSTTQSKMSKISWSQPPPLILWILSTFQAYRSLTGRSRYGRLALFPYPRTRILSTSSFTVLCIFSLGWVCWWGSD